ncbi:MAG: polyphosphate kinase 2 family protein [Anaerolineae bacterium]|jgi:PPK2 family polyphosphate:nucleotide phosphotransferase|nr:polyphosphate kinase 2 family protein [Anaerolineae bacterium]
MVKYPYTPSPGQPVHLRDYPCDDDGGLSRDEAEATTETLRAELVELQEKLYAEQKQSLLIVLQAMDTGGKDGTIRKVFSGVNPQGLKIAAFKAPTAAELAHDFLWRIHQQTPPRGYIGIFNRSHYEDVLIVRVNHLVPEKVWRKRYEHINHFEQALSDAGTRILKFFLHISKDEQRERLQERLADPAKHWKFSTGDLPVREKWDEYMQAYSDAIHHCHRDHAPWHIVPANRKWYRNYVVMRAVVEQLREMSPQYPAAEAGLAQVVIPD